jgi:uncharacterized protein (TIGR01777 family)
MIGTRLTAFLSAQGHQVAVITRRNAYPRPQAFEIIWDPALNYLEIGQLEGFDVIIHLAGANVGEYWSPGQKKDILDSRVGPTKLLCESILRLAAKPKLLICASAIGFYGNHPPQDILDENSPAGDGYLADVCRQWEEGTNILLQTGIRIVRMRLGVVLSKTGGALAKMLPAFQMGIGGVLGDGRQMISWVALDEVPFCIDHIIKNGQVRGAVNVVSPQPVSNAQFTRILGQVIRRPTVFSVPGFMVRLMFGEMGQVLLLEGAHVLPSRLLASGYQFRYAGLEAALKKVIE